VTLFCNSSGWASSNALSAFFIPKEKTILFRVAILSLAWCQFQKGDDTTDSHSHPFGSDEAIVKTEGSKTAGISDMSL
jgi:hypothetical protein